MHSSSDRRKTFAKAFTHWQPGPLSRTYGGRTRLHDSDEQQIWIDKRDIATMYVNHKWPVDLWKHKLQAIRDSVGEAYRWPRTSMALGTNSFKPQDAILQHPLVDVWNHHMRRDENDSCGAIPRTRTEWPVLSDEQIWNERNMPQVSKVPDPSQMARIWNYVPPRAGPPRFQESSRQSSQSSGSQPSRALHSSEQRHWRKQVNTNAAWGGSNHSAQRTPQRASGYNSTWWPQY